MRGVAHEDVSRDDGGKIKKEERAGKKKEKKRKKAGLIREDGSVF